MSHPSERTVIVKTSTILKVIVILIALWLAWALRDVLALLFVALFLAALMHPAVRWGAKHRIPKGLMVILIYLALFAFTATAFALIIPTLLQQVGSLTEKIGSSLATISTGVQSLREFSEQHGLAQNLSAGVASLQEQVSRAASGLFSTLTVVFGGLAGLAIVLVMAFYMVVQDKEAIQAFHNFVPTKYQNFTANLLTQVEAKIGRWLAGQFVLSLIIGVLYYIGLRLLGVEGALALALFAAFTEFIPYLGPILGGIPIIFVAFTQSPFMAILALILVIIIQQLENQIIVPKVMQKAVGLNPIVSIVAVLVGAKLFGIVGALLAIPIATALSVVLTELYRYHQESQS